MGFADQIQKSGVYLEELATYLEERGLTIDDIPCLTYYSVNHGYYTLGGDGTAKEPVPFIPAGWAFQVRGKHGELEDAYLLRTQNWPEELLQVKRQKDGTTKLEPAKSKKFKQCSPPGHEFIHWTSTMDELIHSPTIMIHEKFTSAALAVKILGIPSIALSGCWNWSKGLGTPKDSIVELFSKLQKNTRVVVCFDGDMLSNPMIMDSASNLKGWIESNRPDLKVVFPSLEEKIGWDDWAVKMGDQAAGAWAEILESEGVDITHLLPVDYLMRVFGVSLCRRGKDHLMVEHNIDNYVRLLEHPEWKDYVSDNLGFEFYNREHIDKPLGIDDFAIKYMRWLEQHVWRGMGRGPVKSYVKDAVREIMKERSLSVPILILERQPEVTEEQAVAAANRLITEGIRVTGPLNKEETVETLLRVSRDMVAMWSDDPSVDAQWALALVGPTGCGKSNFPKSFTACFYDWGYRPRISQFMKEGPRANMEELMRVARDSMIGVFDEYNPDERSARIVEQNLFTLSTQRVSDQRMLHQEQASRLIRHASVMLTTTDKNKNYIRSGKDTGERRFITFEVQGVTYFGGRLTSDRQVIKECGAILLRYGLQMWKQGDKRSATEFSERHTGQYLGDAPGIIKLSTYWASMDLYGALEQFIKDQMRNGKVRFTWPQLLNRLAVGINLTKYEKDDLKNMCIDLGMVNIGKARVNVGEGTIQKDTAYELPDPANWISALCARL